MQRLNRWIEEHGQFLFALAAVASIVAAVVAVLAYKADQEAEDEINKLNTALVEADSMLAEAKTQNEELGQDLDSLVAELENRPPPTPPPPMRYFLRLLTLSCERTEDTTGADEAYLEVNGRRVWAASMNDGQLRNVDEEIEFAGSVSVALYDADGSTFFDSDDYLGRTRITTAEADTGEKEHRFSRDGARYVLTYRVVGR